MVESRGTSSSVSGTNQMLINGRAHSKAIEDFGLLAEVIANTDGDVMDLFVMNLRI